MDSAQFCFSANLDGVLSSDGRKRVAGLADEGAPLSKCPGFLGGTAFSKRTVDASFFWSAGNSLWTGGHCAPVADYPHDNGLFFQLFKTCRFSHAGIPWLHHLR